MQTNWNDKKIEKLKKYLEKGLTTSEIGKKLDLSKNAVIGKIHRLGLNAGNQTGENTPVKAEAKKKVHLFSLPFGKKDKKAKIEDESAPKTETIKPTKAKVVAEKPATATKQTEKVVKTKAVVEKQVEIVKEQESDNSFVAKSLKKAPTLPKKKKNLKGKGEFFYLQDLKFDMCKWPIEETDEEGNFLFCGCKSLEKKQYCAKHFAEAYVKPEDRKTN